MSKPITVLIVDDSAIIRMLFKELLKDTPDIKVIDTAVDPMDAREKIKRLNPDVLTLDIEMPKMDGISFLEKIMTLRPMPVIMVSTLTQKGASSTIRALELGAVDYIAKPLGDKSPEVLKQLQQELISKIRVAAGASFKLSGRSVLGDKQQIASFNPSGICRKVIAIGSSTGGVEALREIFTALPANTPPIVITQHMPAHFTASLAARLSSLSQVKVTEAVDGAKLKAGQAYLAPGGTKHMTVIRKGIDLVCRLQEGDEVMGHRPSVDVLFSSVADVIGADAIGVILTGMGKDGAEGMLKMHRAGAYNIGQNQASCVVYGMPKAANLLGGVDVELPLNTIAAALLKACETKRAHVG